MIPVPDYLKQYAANQTQKGKTLSFKLKCPCGCNHFSILEKCYSEDEMQLVNEYEKNCPKTGWHTIHGGLDSDGKPYAYIKILGIIKKYITFPEMPICMSINAIKAVCSECQKEILLFDSRFHGYDGMTSNDENANKYDLHFKCRDNKTYSVVINVENETDLDMFNELLEEQFSFEFYSNSYHCIHIYGIDESGKNILLLDYEAS